MKIFKKICYILILHDYITAYDPMLTLCNYVVTVAMPL